MKKYIKNFVFFLFIFILFSSSFLVYAESSSLSIVTTVQSTSESDSGINNPESDPYVLIDTIDNFSVVETDSIVIHNLNPEIIGYSQPYKNVSWQLLNSQTEVLLTGTQRADEFGLLYVGIKDLTLSEEYFFEFYFIENGITYSDKISLKVVDSVLVVFSGYAHLESRISAFYNNGWVELGKSNENGSFVLELEILDSYSGDILLQSLLDDSKHSDLILNYSGQNQITEIIFPPILSPASQVQTVNSFASVKVYSTPNSEVDIYLDNKLYQTMQIGSSGKEELTLGKFIEEKQFSVESIQRIDELISKSSNPVFIFVRIHNIPYIYKIGGLAQRYYGSVFNSFSTLSEIATIISVVLVSFSGFLLYSVSSIVGYYSLLYDCLVLSSFFNARDMIKIQIGGVDMGNKKGILYLIDSSSDKISFRVPINSKGFGYIRRTKGTFNSCYIATRGFGWVKNILVRRKSVNAYFLDEVSIDSNSERRNIVFNGEKELFIYPFVLFEKKFDRMLLFLLFPLNLFTLVSSIISFSFVAEERMFSLIFINFVILCLIILMIGYKKSFAKFIKWNGF